MILNEDYKLREDMDEKVHDTLPIELLTGPYKGVLYRYTTVQLREQEDGFAKLQFQYELYEMGDHTETYLRKDPLFTNHIGLILNQIILETLEEPVEDKDA